MSNENKSERWFLSSVRERVCLEADDETMRGAGVVFKPSWVNYRKMSIVDDVEQVSTLGRFAYYLYRGTNKC